MASKLWNWRLKEWPHFTYDSDVLEDLERQFLKSSSIALGAAKHIDAPEKDEFLVEILSDEAQKSSAIEGEYLDRESLQESIKKNLGLASIGGKVPQAEFGIAEMMVGMYRTFDKPLTHKSMFNWHRMLTNGRRDLLDVGRYRTHEDPMQIVSGRLDRPMVHFEAPPSGEMMAQMNGFVRWFNKIHRTETGQVLPLACAGLTHYYFVAIHPFEDGNGRMGRALAEKSIAQSLRRPALISLSQTIDNDKKTYYNALEAHNTTLELTDWLVYFGQTICTAQENAIKTIDFLIQKAKFFDRFGAFLNDRQHKVVKRLFAAGHEGFKGGLSADNYLRIARTSASTATRDLKDLIDKGILTKTGNLKSTRYSLNLEGF